MKNKKVINGMAGKEVGRTSKTAMDKMMNMAGQMAAKAFKKRGISVQNMSDSGAKKNVMNMSFGKKKGISVQNACDNKKK